MMTVHAPSQTYPHHHHHHYSSYRPGALEPHLDMSRRLDMSHPFGTSTYRTSTSRTTQGERGSLPPPPPKRAREPSPPPPSKRARTSSEAESGGGSPARTTVLPSIANLLGIADGSRSQRPLPQPADVYRDVAPRQSSPRLAATNHASSVDAGRTSPPSASSSRASEMPSAGLRIAALNNVDPEQQRRAIVGPSAPSASSSKGPHSAPYSTPPPYHFSPSAMSTASMPTGGADARGATASGPVSAPSSFHGAAPSSFTPTSSAPPTPTTTSHPSWPHQPPPQHHHHHHYINASSTSGFASAAAAAQERYVCAKCNKAFSRPSSLKIHSHSHTGEKPFICPYPGCAKSFSVRSNMRRHERGCHSAAAVGVGASVSVTGAAGPAQPQPASPSPSTSAGPHQSQL